MREGWERKKLEEVCEINYGTRVVQQRDGGSIYPVYGGGGATFKMDKYNREDCLIVSRFAMSPQCVRYVKGKFFLNDSGLSVESSLSILSQKFLNKHIIALNDKIYSLGKGAAQKNLDVNAFKNIDIHYPISLSEQEKIVAELDCLSGIIEKKKQQLKELDSLAQSIFYEMFGDPVENEKGWEVAPLKESVTEMFLGPFGSALKTECYVNQEDSFCMVYEQKHAIRKTLDTETHYINKEKFESLKRFEVHSGDFIMSCRGTIGEIYRLPSNAPLGIIHPSLMKIRIKEDKYSSTFFVNLLSYIIKNECTVGNCIQMAITAKELGQRKSILPPLSLQQQFANKIELIEKQKELIKQSIKETETLFDSRMDYYFNS
jgi:type I restriction enzyme S subunit